MPLVPTPAVAPRGYSAVELARAAGVSTGTIKHWFAEGLMDKPAFRGRRPTYGREHLVRALAIKKLREHNLLLPEIKRKLAAIPLEELAKEVLPPGAARERGARRGGARGHGGDRSGVAARGADAGAGAARARGRRRGGAPDGGRDPREVRV